MNEVAWEKISFIKALDALVDYHTQVREKMHMTTAAAIVPAAPQKKNKFVSFLDHVGHDIKVGLDKVLPIAATAGEAAIGIFFPGMGPLFNQTVAAVATAEQNAIAIGQGSGSGVQKSASVIQLMGGLIKQGLADLGRPNDDAAVQKYIDEVVAILKTIPAPTPITIDASPAATAAAATVPPNPGAKPAVPVSVLAPAPVAEIAGSSQQAPSALDSAAPISEVL